MSVVFQLQCSVRSGGLNREAVVPKAQHARASPLRVDAAFPRGGSVWSAELVSFCALRTALCTDCPCGEATQRIRCGRSGWRTHDHAQAEMLQRSVVVSVEEPERCTASRSPKEISCIRRKKGWVSFSSTEENATVKKYRLLRELRIC